MPSSVPVLQELSQADNGRGLGSSMGWVGLGRVRNFHGWNGLGWVGFTYQNVYIFCYYNYQTACVNQSLQYILRAWVLRKFRQLGIAFYLFIYLVSLFVVCGSFTCAVVYGFRQLYQIMLMTMMMMIMTKLVICIFFAFSDIFSCVLLQLTIMHYVYVCCWVGLGRVRSAYISCGLGWVHRPLKIMVGSVNWWVG